MYKFLDLFRLSHVEYSSDYVCQMYMTQTKLES
jgi:hypothetical protein